MRTFWEEFQEWLAWQLIWWLLIGIGIGGMFAIDWLTRVVSVTVIVTP